MQICRVIWSMWCVYMVCMFWATSLAGSDGIAALLNLEQALRGEYGRLEARMGRDRQYLEGVELFNQASVKGPVQLRTKPIGLANLGVTCYMNGALQMLLASPLLTATIMPAKIAPQNPVSVQEAYQWLAWQYMLDGGSGGLDEDTMKWFYRVFNTRFSEEKLKHLGAEEREQLREAAMQPMEQDDVSVPLFYILDALADSNSKIRALFGFTTSTKRVLMEPELYLYQPATRESHLALNVSLPASCNLEEGMNKEFSESPLSGWWPSGRGTQPTGVALKGMSYMFFQQPLPPILIIYAKILVYEPRSGALRRLPKCIFPLELKCKKGWIEDGEHLKDDKVPRYELRSFAVHRGAVRGSKTSGHYYAYVRYPDGWFEANDEKIVHVDAPFIQHIAATGSHRGDVPAVFFYERTR